MGLTLISASPSAYARKIRIALLEHNIPYTLQNEVPWDSTTTTPQHNPLEKLPILLLDDGRAVYESYFILEYIAAKLAPDILPADADAALAAKQIQVIADGMMDATSLLFFESQRGDGQSAEWTARQRRKINGGLKALDGLVKGSDGSGFLVGGQLSVADIAVGSLLGAYEIMQMRPFKEEFPVLGEYWEKLEERESFKQTRPYMFEIKDKIV